MSCAHNFLGESTCEHCGLTESEVLKAERARTDALMAALTRWGVKSKYNQGLLYVWEAYDAIVAARASNVPDETCPLCRTGHASEDRGAGVRWWACPQTINGFLHVKP